MKNYLYYNTLINKIMARQNADDPDTLEHRNKCREMSSDTLKILCESPQHKLLTSSFIEAAREELRKRKEL
jgi:hypothetical protein